MSITTMCQFWQEHTLCPKEMENDTVNCECPCHTDYEAHMDQMEDPGLELFEGIMTYQFKFGDGSFFLYCAKYNVRVSDELQAEYEYWVQLAIPELHFEDEEPF